MVMIMFTLEYCWWFLILTAHLILETSSSSSSEPKNRSNPKAKSFSASKESIASPVFRHFGSWKNKILHGRTRTSGTETPSSDSGQGVTSGFVNKAAWIRSSGHGSMESKLEMNYPVKSNDKKVKNKQKPLRKNFASDEKSNHRRNSVFGNSYQQSNKETDFLLDKNTKKKYFKSNSLLGVILTGFKGSLFPFLPSGENEQRTKATARIKSDSIDNDIHREKGDDIETKEINFQGFLFGSLDQSTTKPTTGCTDAPPIVLNKSIDCFHETLNKITLSDDQLMQVLSDQGGSYVKDYMATSPEMANNNFKNLISLMDDYPDSNFKRHPTDWLWNYDMTKAKLLEQLEISHLQLLHVKPDDLPINGYVENHWQYWMNSTKRRDQIIVERLHHHLTSAKHMNNNISRQIMADDGSVSTMEYCQTRGAESADGYLHMCTTCAHTTTLPDDKFPRVLNEAVCHSQDSGCLFVGDTPHGSCRQNVFYMNMLRKREGKCMMVIHDGTTVLTDEWELYSQPIRVSCECLVNKRSPVAKNVNPN